MARIKIDFGDITPTEASAEDRRMLSTDPNQILMAGFDLRARQAQEQIAQRGNVWGNITSDLQAPSGLRKVMGGLQAMGSPLTQLEAGISNPALAMQQGEFNPATLAKEAALGFTGRKQGQYGDIMRIAGYPKVAAAGLGFTLSMSPVKVAHTINKTYGAITKLTDVGLKRAGKDLIQASMEAERFVGGNLNKVFQAVDRVTVDGNRFINTVVNLPKPLINLIETTYGRIEDLAQALTVGQLRQVKQLIGKYRPGIWGREARGLTENIDADIINKVYGGIKTLLGDSVQTAAGRKIAKSLMSLEDSFSEVARASDYIKRTIIEGTLRKPTKAGAMAKKMGIWEDISGREALNTLKAAGKEARRNVNKAAEEMAKFNRWAALARTGKRIAGAGIYGGMAGSLGGLIMGKIIEKGQD